MDFHIGFPEDTDGSDQYDDDIHYWFSFVDTNGSGRINCVQLCDALFGLQGVLFTTVIGDLLVQKFNKDGSGTIDPNEFQHLDCFVRYWLQIFYTYSGGPWGYIEDSELLQKEGFDCSPQQIREIFDATDPINGLQMELEDFFFMITLVF